MEAIIITILILVTISLLMIFIVRPYLLSLTQLEENRLANEKYALFSSIDTEILKSNLNTLVDEKIREYILFRLGGKEYISSEDAENIVSTVTNALYIELSELHLFYIKLLVNIDTDDDVLVFLNTLVKSRALLIITDINKMQQ